MKEETITSVVRWMPITILGVIVAFLVLVFGGWLGSLMVEGVK